MALWVAGVADGGNLLSVGCLNELSIMGIDCKSSTKPSLKADPTVCTKSTESHPTRRMTGKAEFPTEAQKGK